MIGRDETVVEKVAEVCFIIEALRHFLNDLTFAPRLENIVEARHRDAAVDFGPELFNRHTGEFQQTVDVVSDVEVVAEFCTGLCVSLVIGVYCGEVLRRRALVSEHRSKHTCNIIADADVTLVAPRVRFERGRTRRLRCGGVCRFGGIGDNRSIRTRRTDGFDRGCDRIRSIGRRLRCVRRPFDGTPCFGRSGVERGKRHAGHSTGESRIHDVLRQRCIQTRSLVEDHVLAELLPGIHHGAFKHGSRQGTHRTGQKPLRCGIRTCVSQPLHGATADTSLGQSSRTTRDRRQGAAGEDATRQRIRSKPGQTGTGRACFDSLRLLLVTEVRVIHYTARVAPDTKRHTGEAAKNSTTNGPAKGPGKTKCGAQSATSLGTDDSTSKTGAQVADGIGHSIERIGNDMRERTKTAFSAQTFLLLPVRVGSDSLLPTFFTAFGDELLFFSRSPQHIEVVTEGGDTFLDTGEERTPIVIFDSAQLLSSCRFVFGQTFAYECRSRNFERLLKARNVLFADGFEDFCLSFSRQLGKIGKFFGYGRVVRQSKLRPVVGHGLEVSGSQFFCATIDRFVDGVPLFIETTVNVIHLTSAASPSRTATTLSTSQRRIQQRQGAQILCVIRCFKRTYVDGGEGKLRHDVYSRVTASMMRRKSAS